LTRQINVIEGVGMTRREQIEQVLWLKEQYPNKNLTELAKTWNIKPSALQNAYNERKTHERAHRFDYDLDRLKVAQKTALALGKIHNDIVFEKSVGLIADLTDVQSSEIVDMVADINKARDEKSQIEIVKKYRAGIERRLDLSRAKHGRIQPTGARKAIRMARALNNILDTPLHQLHLAAIDDLEQVKILWADLGGKMKHFGIEVDRLIRLKQNPARPSQPSSTPPGTQPQPRA
jgi:hypothetical protein